MLKRVFPFFASGGSNGAKAWNKGGYLYTPVPNVQTRNLPVPEFTNTGNNISGVNSYDLIKEPNPSKTLNYELYGDISPNPNNSPLLQISLNSLDYIESGSRIGCLRCTDNGSDSVTIEILLKTSGAVEQKAYLIVLAFQFYSMLKMNPAYRSQYTDLFGDRTPEQVQEFLLTYGLAPFLKKQEYVASQVPPDSELARTVVASGAGEILYPPSYRNVSIFSFDIWSLEGMDNPNNTTLDSLHKQYSNQSILLGPRYVYLMGNDIIYETYMDNISKDNEVYTKCFANPEVKSARNIGVFVQPAFA